MSAPSAPTRLRVHGQVTPLDVEATPRFNWIATDQDAYQLQIASCPRFDDIQYDSGFVSRATQSTVPDAAIPGFQSYG